MRVEVLYLSAGGERAEGWDARFLAAYGEVREALGALRVDLDLAAIAVDEMKRHVQFRLGAALDPLRARANPSASVIHDFRVLLAETPDGAIAVTTDIWPDGGEVYGRVTAWLREARA